MPGEPGRIREDLLAEALRALRFDKSCDQRDHIIRERCRAHWILSVAGAVPAGEVTEAGLFE